MDRDEMYGARSLPHKPLTRRMMIGVLGAGTVAAVAAACGGAPAVSPTMAPTAEAAKSAGTAAPADGATAAVTKPAGTAAGAATTPTPAPAATTAAKPAAGGAPESGTLVIGFWQEPDTLNPYLSNMIYSILVNGWINAEMLKIGRDDALVPHLLKVAPNLENGGISKDGLTYTLSFKEGLKWSDGQPLTADDLVFTWKLIMDPKFGSTSTTGWDRIKDIELSSDKLTATVRLNEVHVPFIGDVLTSAAGAGGAFLLPKHFLEKIPVEKMAEDPFNAQGGNKFIGAGPFKVKEWRKGVSLTLDRNPNWMGAKPKLEKVIFSFVGTRAQEIDGLRAGALDYAVDFAEAQIPDLEKLPETTVFPSVAAGTVERYYFNMWDPGSDRTKPHRIWGGPDGAKTRLALALALNRQAVVDKILHGKTTVAVNEMDGSSEWKTAGQKPYPYDVRQAEQILDALGWKKGADGIRERNGVRFEFTHATTAGSLARAAVQRAFIADLEKVGIRMKIENYKPAELFAQYSQNGPAATGNKLDMWGWTTGSTDPSIYYDLFHSEKIPTKERPDGNNYTGFKHPKMDELSKKQLGAIDPKERKAVIDQIQQLIYDEVPVLYLFNRLNIDVAKSYVTGVEPYPAARFFWNVETWGLTKKR